MRAVAAVCVGLALSLAAACGDEEAPGSPTPSPEATASPPSISTATPAPTAPGTFSLQPPGTPVPPGRGEPSGRIAFVSFRDGQQEIYVMNADGSDLKNITGNEATDFDPDWSPDGAKIVFVSNRDGPAAIYSMNADGSDVRRLTEKLGGISPKWSPDGARIVYSRGGTLMVMDADGANPTAIYENSRGTPGVPCSAGGILGDWSPDGEWLVFNTASLQQDTTEICAITADGSDLRVVTKDPPALHAEPNWSPDSTRLAYRSIRDGVHEIYVYDLVTGGEVKLTEDDDLNAEPAWSPDGGWLVFVSDRDSLQSDIYVMSSDGSDVRRLTTDPAKDSFPTWAP